MSRPSGADAAAAKQGGAPSRVRYGVLGFAASLSMITYLDRAAIAAAGPAIALALGLEGVKDLGVVFTAFTLAYALFEVPSGWLGDVFGPRSVLIRIVLWWSAFTAITGLVGLRLGPVTMGFTLLVVVRFLFGMGEAGAYPNITRALHNWFPLLQRGFAQGAVWMSGRLMGGLTPLVWVLLVEGVHLPSKWLDASSPSVQLTGPLIDWRGTFWLFGGIGTLWCVAFALWFRNHPEQKPRVNQAELDLIRAGRGGETQAGHANVPWMKILRGPNLWFLCLMYACQSYGWYFNITYLPGYLEEHYQVPKESLLGAVFKGGPLWMGAIGCLLGGYLADWYLRRIGDRRRARRNVGAMGHSCSVLCFIACVFVPTAPTAWAAASFFLMISLSAFFSDMTMGSSWALTQDLGRRHAGLVAGFMNMVGNLGGAVGSLMPSVLERFWPESYKTINFSTYAVAYAVAVFCWLKIDANKPIVPDEEPA